jgi:hypothetical protein
MSSDEAKALCDEPRGLIEKLSFVAISHDFRARDMASYKAGFKVGVEFISDCDPEERRDALNAFDALTGNKLLNPVRWLRFHPDEQEAIRKVVEAAGCSTDEFALSWLNEAGGCDDIRLWLAGFAEGVLADGIPPREY